MQINLDLSGVSGELSEFQLIPSGVYNFSIVNADWKETKKKDGSFLVLSLQVTEGEQAGKKISQNITVTNPTPKAVEIGLQTLKQIMTQIEHPNPNLLGNLEELINGKTFRSLVDVESYSRENGSAGQKSVISKLVSKDVQLKDGDASEVATTRAAKSPAMKPPAMKPPAMKPLADQPKVPSGTTTQTAVPAWMAK